MSSRRIAGLDIARGIASLVMIQGHAYHGWVAPESRDAAYTFTRWLGTLPLPSFLVLAGAAIAWRLDAAERKGEAFGAVRRSLGMRGLQVMAWGYGSNVAYALIDGFDSWRTFFRADVLQLIGLCILLTAAALPATPRRMPRFRWGLGIAGVASVLLCPALTFGNVLPDPLTPIAGLFFDVQGITLMPFFPLFSWFAGGYFAGRYMLGHRDESAFSEEAGIAALPLLRLAAFALGIAAAGHTATQLLLDLGNAPLSRAHIAVWPNAVEGFGRGLLLLCAGAASAPLFSGRPRKLLIGLGQSSLIAYVLHVPFCYGRLGAPLLHNCTMAQATPWVIALGIGSASGALGWRRFQRWRRHRTQH